MSRPAGPNKTRKILHMMGKSVENEANRTHKITHIMGRSVENENEQEFLS